jgi:hypothetical protein
MHGATYFQSRRLGIGIEDSTSPKREVAITPTLFVRYFRIGPVCLKYIAAEGLKKGWRRTLREMRIAKVQSAKPAEVYFNFAKLECGNRHHLGRNQWRNQVQPLPSCIRFDGLFKQGQGLGGTLLRQEFGDCDGGWRVLGLVQGEFSPQSPTEYGRGQKKESTLECKGTGNLRSRSHLPAPLQGPYK